MKNGDEESVGLEATLGWDGGVRTKSKALTNFEIVGCGCLAGLARGAEALDERTGPAAAAVNEFSKAINVVAITWEVCG